VTGDEVTAEVPAHAATADEVAADAATAGSLARLHALVQARLQRADQRYTGGRRAIVGLLLRSGHPVSISDIVDALPDLPRSSAYRHLVDLQAAGVVRRVAGSDEFGRFELAEHLTEHHHHLLCTACGKVTDITPSPEFERAVSSHLEDLAAARGFELRSHRIDVLGVCSQCR
jgi:Fe2+ or Zn2+ uptake regulation protein